MAGKASREDFIEALKLVSDQVRDSLSAYFLHADSVEHTSYWHVLNNWFFLNDPSNSSEKTMDDRFFSSAVLSLLRSADERVIEDIRFIEEELVRRRLCLWSPEGTTRTDLWLKTQSQEGCSRKFSSLRLITSMRYQPLKREVAHWFHGFHITSHIVGVSILINIALSGLQQFVPSFSLNMLLVSCGIVSGTAALAFIVLTFVCYGLSKSADKKESKDLLFSSVHRVTSTHCGKKPFHEPSKESLSPFHETA